MTKTDYLQDAQITDTINKKKTNADWYKIEILGSYFKCEEGVLLQCPMNSDGSRDNNPFEVGWGRVEADAVDGRSLRAVDKYLR